MLDFKVISEDNYCTFAINMKYACDAALEFDQNYIKMFYMLPV